MLKQLGAVLDFEDTTLQMAIAQARVCATHQTAELKDREKQAGLSDVFKEYTTDTQVARNLADKKKIIKILK